MNLDEKIKELLAAYACANASIVVCQEQLALEEMPDLQVSFNGGELEFSDEASRAYMEGVLQASTINAEKLHLVFETLGIKVIL